jgi:hypothetical protein
LFDIPQSAEGADDLAHEVGGSVRSDDFRSSIATDPVSETDGHGNGALIGERVDFGPLGERVSDAQPVAVPMERRRKRADDVHANVSERTSRRGSVNESRSRRRAGQLGSLTNIA